MHCHVSSGAHGNADIGRGSAGASLTPSPAIATTPSRLLNSSSLACFSGVISQLPRQPEPAGNLTGGLLVVARQHDDLETGAMQIFDSFGVLDLMGSETASRPAGLHPRRPPRRRCVPHPEGRSPAYGAAAEGCERLISPEAALSYHNILAGDGSRTPPPGGLKSNLGECCLPGRAHDSASQGMFAPLFEGRRQGYDFFLLMGARALPYNAGSPSVRVPVLSTTSARLAQHFEGFSVLEEHAHVGTTPDRDHDRHRRGQPQRTRARDDEHGHRID